MQYHRCRITDRIHHSETLFELRLDRLLAEPKPGDLAGRYYFLCVPGVGEKPFAVFSAKDKSVVVKVVGVFTKHLASAKAGDELLLRGPYGRPVTPVADCAEHILVGGGTGIASLLEIGYKLAGISPLTFVLGGRSKADLFGLGQFAQLGRVVLATNDGSTGHAGHASVALQAVLREGPPRRWGFMNCGPEPMIRACAELELAYAPPERILAAIEYMTSCGVGICGKCAAPSGQLSCIDGPFMPLAAFAARHKIL
jgi:dihydroorotate dehydrogenase (NAD+) catalytic subunit